MVWDEHWKKQKGISFDLRGTQDRGNSERQVTSRSAEKTDIKIVRCFLGDTSP